MILKDKFEHPFEVRDFGVDDRAALERMYTEFQPKRAAQGLPPETSYATKRWLDHIMKGGMHLLVVFDGDISGHLMLIPMEDGHSVELAIFLHQGIRGRGIGTAMNRHAVTVTRENGFQRIWLSVEPNNIAAVRSYQKAGFQPLRHSMYAQEIEMEIRLEEPQT